MGSVMDLTVNKMTIVPDVHGRQFWRKAIEDPERGMVVFLGDYMDMYPVDGIFYREALANFDEIISLKKSDPDNVVLLLGNHDISYWTNREWARVRYDRYHNKEISARFCDNRDLFQLAYQNQIGGRRYLFSHAGISKPFLERCGVQEDEENLAKILNDKFKEDSEDFFKALAMISWWRGGSDEFGSMVWADVNEYGLCGEDLVGDYQIFGHTWLEHPFISDKFACLDCCRAFTLEDNNILEQID